MIEQLEAWDTSLFLFLNGLHNHFWDVVMYWVSYPPTWIPLYLLCLYLLQRKYGWKNMLWIVLAVGVLVLLTDQISYNGFKEQFQRYRPCHNLLIKDQLHLVGNCGGKHGFLSGHSTNSFGVALFIGLLMRSRPWQIGLLFWAALVAYSRVYLGVHYPADIFCGMLLGLLLGYVVVLLLKRFLLDREARTKP